MMKSFKNNLLALILISLTTPFWAQNVIAAQGDNLPLYSKVYDAKRDPFKDAAAAIKLAGETNRNVLIEIGGDWCTWCHKIDAFLEKNPDIYNELHSSFVLLKINVSDENENAKFMAGLPKVLGYPHMYVSTGQGKVILSKDTAEFLDSSGVNYSRDNWLSFINQFKAANNKANLKQYEIDKLTNHPKTK